MASPCHTGQSLGVVHLGPLLLALYFFFFFGSDSNDMTGRMTDVKRAEIATPPYSTPSFRPGPRSILA